MELCVPDLKGHTILEQEKVLEGPKTAREWLV